MALYTNTLTCTWLKLQTALSGAGTLTANTSITVSDPANVVIGNSDTSGTLGYLIKSYTGSYLLDFTPSDFSTATYTANSNSLFYNCTKLSGMCKLPSSITNAFRMFSGCAGLMNIDTSGFTNVTNASNMFYNCVGLTSIDTSGFTNVTDASSMFYNCAGLTSNGKGWYEEVKIIEKRPYYYLYGLKHMLENQLYKTSEYKIFEKDCVTKVREIYKLPFYPDRICQWAILQVIQDTLIKNFILDTYSAIPKRGIGLGFKRVKNAIVNDYDNCKYCLKLDIRHFYPTIDHEILKEKYKRLFKDKNLL